MTKEMKTKVAVIAAIEAAGYEVFDFRFVEGLGYYGLLTVAWDSLDNIKVAEGDYRQYYSNYENIILVGEHGYPCLNLSLTALATTSTAR